MAKITFGQITLEDPNKSLQELVQIYKGLFVNEEFALPLISTVADEEDMDIDEEDDTEEEIEEETPAPTQPVQSEQPQVNQQTQVQNNF